MVWHGENTGRGYQRETIFVVYVRENSIFELPWESRGLPRAQPRTPRSLEKGMKGRDGTIKNLGSVRKAILVVL